MDGWDRDIGDSFLMAYDSALYRGLESGKN
jgi:hypothetical protein